MASVNDGLILREDASLKAHLGGMTVVDATSGAGGRNVPVYYRLPEQEARQRNYPYLTIDLLSIARDPTREHRGNYRFAPLNGYMPMTRLPNDQARTDWPIPLLFVYQITSFARFVQHDRQIMAKMMTGPLLERFGALNMVTTSDSDVVDDNSMRRLDLISGPTTADSPDPADPNKRIFRKAYTVQMSSELFPQELTRATTVLPDEIFIDLHYYQAILTHIVRFSGSGSLQTVGH